MILTAAQMNKKPLIYEGGKFHYENNDISLHLKIICRVQFEEET